MLDVPPPPRLRMDPTPTTAALEEILSRPTPGVLDTLRRCAGDFIVLGAAGKMGPSLARMVRRGLGAPRVRSHRVLAVSRFSSPDSKAQFEEHGVPPIVCDLLDRDS